MEQSLQPEGSAVSRRDALRIALGTAALAALSGCASTRGAAGDVADANRDLQEILEQMEGSEVRQTQLVTIARRIGYQTRDLATEHDIFWQRLDVFSRDRTKGPEDLEDVIGDFRSRRTAQRRELFKLTDELRRELTAAEWDQVVASLMDLKGASVPAMEA